MHEDLEHFATLYDEKQRAASEAFRLLTESNRRFLATSPNTIRYYAVSDAHRKAFDDWIDASRELDRAREELFERALDVAKVPRDHPLRKRQHAAFPWTVSYSESNDSTVARTASSCESPTMALRSRP